MLAIDFLWRGEPRVLYAKQESLNLTGSIKDRMALYILEDAYARGTIKPGDPIAEATSGNTGISFAAIGRALGHPVTIFMPDWMSVERVSLISSFGASIVPVSRADGGFLGSIRTVRGTCGPRSGGVPALSVFERRERAGPFRHNRPGDLAAAGSGRSRARRVRRRRRHGRHGHGRRPLPARPQAIGQSASARARGVADAHDGPQSRSPPNSGCLRRVHSRDRQAERARSDRRRSTTATRF